MSDRAVEVLLALPGNPLADPVARLDPALPPPPHLESLHLAVRSELRRAIRDAASGSAAMALVCGEPGQGKTHELAHLRATATDYHFVDVPPLKDEHAPFAHVLRYTVHGLLGEKRPFLWEALRRVAEAVRDGARDEGDHATAERLDVALGGPRHYVQAFRVFARSDPAIADLIDRRGRVAMAALGVDADFGRVLTRIVDPDGEALALDWLRGAELPEEDLFLLGVRRCLDGEARCFEALRALVRLAARPVVLCFDQLEAVLASLGTDGVRALFNALMEVYQQLPVCVVLMCQAEVWGRVAGHLEAAMRQRVRELPRLEGPRPSEAVGLVAARLAPVWARAEVTPPYPSWPFSTEFLGGYVERVTPTVRGVLAHCAALLDGMRARGVIAEPIAGDDAPRVAVIDPVAVLARDHDERQRDVREKMASPKLRQDHVRNAIARLLAGAMERGRSVAGTRVLAVDAPGKPKDGPRPPILVTVEKGGLRARVAMEVNSDDDGRSARWPVARLVQLVERGAADAAVLLREASVPLADGTKTAELVASLEPRGGLRWLEAEDAHRLVAAELLLDAVAASEVWAGERPVAAGEAMAYLLEHGGLDGPLAPALSMVTLPSPPRQRTPDDDLGARIVSVLAADSAMMPVPRVAGALGVEAAALEPVLERLARERRIELRADADGARIVTLLR